MSYARAGAKIKANKMENTIKLVFKNMKNTS